MIARMCQVSASRLRDHRDHAAFAVARPDQVGNGRPALQGHDHKEQVGDQDHDPQRGEIGRTVKAEQQRHVGERHAEHREHHDAPDPHLDIGGGLVADDEQARLARGGRHQRLRRADHAAAEHVGVDDREDDDARPQRAADFGREQHVADRRERDHRRKLDGEAREHERQPEHQLVGIGEAAVPPQLLPQILRRQIFLLWRQVLRRQVWRRQVLRRQVAALRLQPRGSMRARRDVTHDGRERPSQGPPHDPFDGERAGEHQRELPRGVEQQMTRVGVLHEMADPMQDHRKVGHRACGGRELAGGLAEPVRHLHHDLHAEIVGGKCCGRRWCRAGRRRLGDGLQRLNELAALAVVLQDFERLLCLGGGHRRCRTRAVRRASPAATQAEPSTRASRTIRASGSVFCIAA